MKKIIATVMAAAAIASTMSMSAFAATTEIKSNSFNASVIDLRNPDNVFVEKGNAVKDVVTPGKSLFIQIPDGWYIDPSPDLAPTDDEDYFTYKVKAIEGAKHIAGYSYFVSKNDLEIQNINATETTKTISGRHTYIEIKLKDNVTDTENKIKLELTIKGKKDYSGSATYTSYAIFVGNQVVTGDHDFDAGTVGVVLKPSKNEDNEIVWQDGNRDLAKLTFFGDSDVVKSYPKLSTKWENSDYAEYFADQDAFLFDFVANVEGQTKISSTSRGDLEIYNPYVNEDEELTVEPEDVIIYSVAPDGTFTDVTAQFKGGENDDGDYVFTTKTRELGTYIFAEKVAGATVEEEVTAPDTGKDIPNTGR